MDALRRGFKARAEKIAAETRGELGLSSLDRFEPRVLAEHLAIPVVSLPALALFGASAEAIQHFMQTAPGDFSAMTIVDGHYRLIVENPRHSHARRSSSLSHELSHILLEHEP